MKKQSGEGEGCQCMRAPLAVRSAYVFLEGLRLVARHAPNRTRARLGAMWGASVYAPRVRAPSPET
jgi:hypothetical protein